MHTALKQSRKYQHQQQSSSYSCQNLRMWRKCQIWKDSTC